MEIERIMKAVIEKVRNICAPRQHDEKLHCGCTDGDPKRNATT